MITIYTTSSCSSCRKAKKWFDDHNIEYKEVNIFVKNLSHDELTDMLMRTENGAEDIVSKRSKVIMEQNIDVDSLTVSQLVDFLIENPSAMRRPIIIDERHFQVGYNDDEIRAFIPRELRDMSCEFCDVSDECNLHES